MAKQGAHWSDIKQRIKAWDNAELLGLVRDLFDLSPENRQFMAARLLRASAREADAEWTAASLRKDDLPDEKALAPFRRRIEGAFYNKRGGPLLGPLRLAEGRKAIRDYQRATGDLPGTVDLMLHFVETGTRFTLELGDIDGPFYDSLESVLVEIEKAFMEKDGMAWYPLFRDRLLKLREKTGWIGWGYGDAVEVAVDQLEKTSESEK